MFPFVTYSSPATMPVHQNTTPAVKGDALTMFDPLFFCKAFFFYFPPPANSSVLCDPQGSSNPVRLRYDSIVQLDHKSSVHKQLLGFSRAFVVARLQHTSSCSATILRWEHSVYPD